MHLLTVAEGSRKRWGSAGFHCVTGVDGHGEADRCLCSKGQVIVSNSMKKINSWPARVLCDYLYV